jgi:hypothetical protein
MNESKAWKYGPHLASLSLSLCLLCLSVLECALTYRCALTSCPHGDQVVAAAPASLPYNILRFPLTEPALFRCTPLKLSLWSGDRDALIGPGCLPDRFHQGTVRHLSFMSFLAQ